MERYQEIERSIIKRFRKEIWRKFISGINDYEMIQPGDRIAVCISGGKDSMLLAKCMQEVQRHGKMDFELEFIVMDPGYNPANRQKIIDNSKIMNIPVKIFDSDIFNIVHDVENSPCYLCARMRRGSLYHYAQELNCNKIALGHHFDDVIETTMMSMMYMGQFKTMMPKLHSTNFKGMELIRPLYLVKEFDIKSWVRYNNLEFLQCACRFTENTEKGTQDSKRQEVKQLINRLREVSPVIDMNIFQSAHNVNVNTVIGYEYNDVEHRFLDLYPDMK